MRQLARTLPPMNSVRQLTKLMPRFGETAQQNALVSCLTTCMQGNGGRGFVELSHEIRCRCRCGDLFHQIWDIFEIDLPIADVCVFFCWHSAFSLFFRFGFALFCVFSFFRLFFVIIVFFYVFFGFFLFFFVCSMFVLCCSFRCSFITMFVLPIFFVSFHFYLTVFCVFFFFFFRCFLLFCLLLFYVFSMFSVCFCILALFSFFWTFVSGTLSFFVLLCFVFNVVFLFCMFLAFSRKCSMFFVMFFLHFPVLFQIFSCVLTCLSVFAPCFFVDVLFEYSFLVFFFFVLKHGSLIFNVGFRICPLFLRTRWVASPTLCVRLLIKLCVFGELLRHMHMQDNGLKRFWWAVWAHQEHPDCFCALLRGMCQEIKVQGSAVSLGKLVHKIMGFELARSLHGIYFEWIFSSPKCLCRFTNFKTQGIRFADGKSNPHYAWTDHNLWELAWPWFLFSRGFTSPRIQVNARRTDRKTCCFGTPFSEAMIFCVFWTQIMHTWPLGKSNLSARTLTPPILFAAGWGTMICFTSIMCMCWRFGAWLHWSQEKETKDNLPLVLRNIKTKPGN